MQKDIVKYFGEGRSQTEKRKKGEKPESEGKPDDPGLELQGEAPLFQDAPKVVLGGGGGRRRIDPFSPNGFGGQL